MPTWQAPPIRQTFPMQTAILGPGGAGDAFAAKLNSSGSGLLYSTQFGGSNVDDANAIAIDGTGAAYVAGDTASIDFPTSSGAFQTAVKGVYDAFAVELTPAGSALAYATLLGGSGSDTATAIAVDQAGRAVLAGFTLSPDFPTRCGPRANRSQLPRRSTP